MAVSFFERDNNPKVYQAHIDTWDGFLEALQSPQPSHVGKKELPLWSPATFRNAYREDGNVETVCLLVLDVDKEPIPTREELRASLEGVCAFVHSSSRASENAPRWRVGIALSRPVTAEEHRRLWKVATARLRFPVGSEAKDPARAWYIPKRGENDYYEFFSTRGAPLDVDALLLEAPAVAVGGSALVGAVAPAPGTKLSAKREAAAIALGEAWPAPGQRHVAQRALAGALYRESWSEEQAVEFLCAVCRTAGDEDRPKRIATCRDTYRRGNAGEEIAGWTTLSSCIDPSVVSDTRAAIQRDDFAEVAKMLGVPATPAGAPGAPATPAPTLAESMATVLGTAPAKPKREKGKLHFDFGVWDTEPPPVEFLVEGLIPRECVAMWYGRADSLKTWLLFSLAIALATGKPWLDKYPTKKVKVGIVDYETGATNVKRRLYMLRAGANKNLGAVAFADLKPSQPEFWGELAKQGFDIVFIDSLRRSNPGADENDSAEAIIPLELAAMFAETTGCAVVYIHHAKKSLADGWPEFRGSAAIEDQVDCSFVVKKNDVDALKKTVEVKCVKPGDMRTPDPFVAAIDFDDHARTAHVRLGAMQDVARDDKLEPAPERIRSEIKLALGTGQALAREEIKARVAGKDKTKLEQLDILVDRGEVDRKGRLYILGSDAARRQRVYEQVREYTGWKSAAALAKASFVPTEYVEGLLREGVLTPRSSGFGGYLVVDGK